jgi:Domain of unknown function (DUF4383)
MVTDTYAEERDMSAPAALAFGALLVILGIAGFFAVGTGTLLGVFQVAMPLSVLQLGVGTALFSTAILGARPARIANFAAAVLFLALAVAGLAGVQAAALNGADTTLDLSLGLVLLAAGRLAPRH